MRDDRKILMDELISRRSYFIIRAKGKRKVYLNEENISIKDIRKKLGEKVRFIFPKVGKMN